MRNDLAILAALALALPGLAAAQAGERKPDEAPSSAAKPGAETAPGPEARPEPPAGAGPAAPAQPASNPATVLAEVVGTVKGIDRAAQKLEVESAGQTVAVSLDRNTMVYTPRGLGTVLDLEPGAQVRVGRNAKFLAYWVQVRPPGGSDAPVSTPAQGSSPTTGSGPPAEGSGAPGAPTGTAPGGGSVSPGATPGGTGR
jgi:hypothetical protein